LINQAFSKIDASKPNLLGNIWFWLSLVLPLYYGLLSLYFAFSQPYIIQDDARNYAPWMQQFIDPDLFPNDWIARYFQTVVPVGYKFCFWIVAKLGIAPMVLAKLLPIALGMVTTLYLFRLSLLIFPVPFSAFLTTLTLNQCIWLKDDLVSSTPRAFTYPFLAAFLYFLLQRSLIPCLITLGLQGLFFPHVLLIQVVLLTLRLFRWQGRSLKFSQDRQDYLFWGAGLCVALLVLLPFALNISEFGSPVTLEQMKTMPEYGWRGRSQFFGTDPISFLLTGSSGIRIPHFPAMMIGGLALPLVLRSREPLVKLISPNVKLLGEVTVASLILYSLAHFLLLQLHFPNRYTYHTLRFVFAIASSIVLTVLLDKGWRWFQQKRQTKAVFSSRQRWYLRLTGFLVGILILVPIVPPLIFLVQDWQVGESPTIYQYLAQQPKDALTASLSPTVDRIPAFAQRPILVGREFALAYHPKYYQEIQDRAVSLIQAQYAPNLSMLQQVVKRYGIDFWLVDNTTFEPNYLLQQDWLVHSSFKDIVRTTARNLQRGQAPALAQVVDKCTVASAKMQKLLDAACLIKGE
jgi:hypothetical protein